MDIWSVITNSKPNTEIEFDSMVNIRVLYEGGHEEYYHDITHMKWEFVEDEQHNTVWYLKDKDENAHVIQKNRLAVSIAKDSM